MDVVHLTGHTVGEVTRDHQLHVSAERTREQFGQIAARIAVPAPQNVVTHLRTRSRRRKADHGKERTTGR